MNKLKVLHPHFSRITSAVSVCVCVCVNVSQIREKILNKSPEAAQGYQEYGIQSVQHWNPKMKTLWKTVCSIVNTYRCMKRKRKKKTYCPFIYKLIFLKIQVILKKIMTLFNITALYCFFPLFWNRCEG